LGIVKQNLLTPLNHKSRLSQSIRASGNVNLGFTITRTSANSGSIANINVNVTDDTAGTYDRNSTNNIFARIISAL